jgi:hypothetical protein
MSTSQGLAAFASATVALVDLNEAELLNNLVTTTNRSAVV